MVFRHNLMLLFCYQSDLFIFLIILDMFITYNIHSTCMIILHLFLQLLLICIIHLETISSYLRIYYFYVFHIAHMK